MLIYLQMLDTPEEKSKFETLYYTHRRTMLHIAMRTEQQKQIVVEVPETTIPTEYDLEEVLSQIAYDIVWVDEKSGVLFWIAANCNEEELIKIAESVGAQKVPIQVS